MNIFGIKIEKVIDRLETVLHSGFYPLQWVQGGCFIKPFLSISCYQFGKKKLFFLILGQSEGLEPNILRVNRKASQVDNRIRRLISFGIQKVGLSDDRRHRLISSRNIEYDARIVNCELLASFWTSGGRLQMALQAQLTHLLL